MSQNLKTKLGLRIKELRTANRYTQEHLAELVGMERTNLTRIEAGKHFPSAENLEKLALALKININDLFSFEHHKRKEELIKEIVKTLDEFEMTKIQYIYISTMNLKKIK